MTAAHKQLFINGKIFTARSEEDFVSAFEVTDGKISWVGEAREVDRTRAVNLQGRTVLPGFIDIHTHPTYVAMTVRAVPCTVPKVTNISEMIESLRTHPNFGKDDGDWIEGWGYDESQLTEHRTPTAEDLDRVSITQPVYVMRSDCHSGICNTRALQIAGITRDTPDPPGARFGRHENGEPNGILQELAANDVVMRAKSSQDYRARVGSIFGTAAHYYERGIVAASEMMACTKPFDDLAVYRAAAARGLRQQILLYFVWTELKENLIPELTDEQRTGRIKFAGLKLFADGSISGRTAWVSEAYPGSKDDGLSTVTDDEMEAAYQWAKRNKVQVSVHAMGDKALQQVIDFFAGKEPWLGSDIPSVRLEHATLVTEEQVRRMNEAKMIFGVATQIIFFFAEHDSYFKNLTPNQYRHAYPLRTCYERIKHLGLSSDAPATTWAEPDNVFVSIEAAVTRKAYNGCEIVPEQAVTVPQAILLYTARAATLGHYDEPVGRIAEGYEADFVILDRDIFTIDVHDIHKTEVEQTWMRGEKVYQRR